MYVKKWLALTLAGAVLAMGFSGCDRTIIEHQFHTDTITNTVTDTVMVEVSVDPSVKRLKELFESQGIKVDDKTIFSYPTQYDEDDEDDKEVIEMLQEKAGRGVSTEEMEAFYQEPILDHRFSVIFEFDVDQEKDDPRLDMSDMVFAWSDGANQIYNAIVQNENWDWETFIKNLDGNTIYFFATNYAVTSDGDLTGLYVEFAIMTPAT